MAEVLVQKSYGFVKPAHIKSSLGKRIGIGLILAEGDQHKVNSLQSQPSTRVNPELS